MEPIGMCPQKAPSGTMTTLLDGVRSQHRHYPYWYEGCFSTRLNGEYPCVKGEYSRAGRPACK